MTQEEKAKAYDEALERAKKYNIDDAHAYQGTLVKLIFPELSEREDERIRKALIDGVSQIRCKGDVTREQMTAYLENQKKEKANLTKEQFIKYGELEYQRGHLQGFTEGYNKAMKEKEIPLMNGDADLYFDNWIQHNDTTKRGCFEEGMRYAQRLKLNTVEQNPKLKFKIGDKVHFPSDCVNTFTITGLRKDAYLTDSAYGPILFSKQDEFELVEDDK